MRVKAGLLCIALLIHSPNATAGTSCANLPAAVNDYLHRHPEWAIVTADNLIDDDKKLWSHFHGRLCPGMAIADLDGSGRKFYALALRRRSNGTAWEELVLIGPNGKQWTEKTLADPDKGDSVLVVWRAPRGKYYSYETNRHFWVRHDSIIYELMESSSIQYYFERGKLRSVQASN